MARARQTPALPPSEAAVRRDRVRTAVTLGLVFFALVLVLDGLVGERGLIANRQARQAYEEESRALENVRTQNRYLREQIERLKSDPAAMEEAVRRGLGYIKPGEKVFYVHDSTPDDKNKKK